MSEDFSFYSDHGKFHKADFINSGNDVLIEAIDVPHFVNVFRQRSSGNIRDILGWKMKAATQNSSVITATVSNFANIEIREYSDDICNANISTSELFIEYNNKFYPESYFSISSQFEGIRNYLNGLSQSETNNFTSIRRNKFTPSKDKELNDYKFMLKKANDEKIETVTYLSYLADGHREIYEYLESWRGEYPKKLNLFSLKSKGFN
jgi:hypothetical protein